MIYTLHRYIFSDLIKTFLIATFVLAMILGLGLMIGPMRRLGIDPIKVPELFLCTLPMTLVMVLPIAALLSATLNYGRLSADNEIAACRASGISILTMVYPALILALIVGVATLLLAFHVVPYFTQQFENILQKDSKALIFRNIQKYGNLNSFGSKLKGIKIAVDHVVPEKDILVNVAVIKLNKEEKVISVDTAKEVYINFRKNSSGKSEVVLQTINTKHLDNTKLISGDIDIVFPMASMWKDDIKFKRLEEMQKIRRDLTLFGPIQEKFLNTKAQMKKEYFYQWANEKFQSPSHSLDLYHGKDRIRIRATACQIIVPAVTKKKTKRGKIKEIINPITSAIVTFSGGDVIVEQYFPERPDRWSKLYVAKNVVFEINSYESKPNLISKIALNNVQFTSGNDDTSSLAEMDILGYVMPPEVADPFDQASLNDLLVSEAVAPLKESSSYLQQKLLLPLKKECGRLLVGINVELHSRLAFGVSCVVMVLFGAALGIYLPSGPSLSAFGLSFLPAVICMATISTGKHMAIDLGNIQLEDNVLQGLLFLWSGIAVMIIANLKLYGILLKR